MTQPLAQLPKDRLELRLADAKPTYTKAEAMAEAERCLYCHDAPCIKACPTEIDIPTFIKKIATDNVRGSAVTIFESNLLGYSCARVCPVEVLCVGSCVYNEWHRAPIQIGRLQRYATEEAINQEQQTGKQLFVPKAKIGKKVALVGAGPASLACAAYLALEGVDTVIFERDQFVGGLNTTGVAPYKLHGHDAIREAQWLQKFGGEIRTGQEVGKTISGKSLLTDYDAVFIGVGLGADSWLKIPGAQGDGVVGATAFIAMLKNKAGFSLPDIKHAVVVGGGNTAIDVARELALLRVSSVSMAYRKSVKDMSGYAHEMEHARQEDVRLVEYAQPTEIVRDAQGKVVSLKVAQLGSDGKPVAGTERTLPADLVVFAIGQSKLPQIAQEFEGVQVDAKGCVVVDPTTRRTANPKVYAGGDCINGGKEVVNAVADGREAAKAMLKQFTG